MHVEISKGKAKRTGAKAKNHLSRLGQALRNQSNFSFSQKFIRQHKLLSN